LRGDRIYPAAISAKIERVAAQMDILVDGSAGDLFRHNARTVSRVRSARHGSGRRKGAGRYVPICSKCRAKWWIFSDHSRVQRRNGDRPLGRSAAANAFAKDPGNVSAWLLRISERIFSVAARPSAVYPKGDGLRPRAWSRLQSAIRVVCTF